MRRLTTHIGLVLWGAASVALAQGTAPEPSAAPTLQIPDAETLAPGQLTGLADQYIQGMKATEVELQGVYAKAKEEKDLVKTLCLNDKVGQVTMAVATAEDRRGALAEALENGGTERARHEFTLIGVLTERVAALAEEANQCIGEETTFTEDNQSTLDLKVEGSLPNVNGETVELPPPAAVAPAVKSPVD